MGSIKIALIDNGVKEPVIGKYTILNMYIDENGICRKKRAGSENRSFEHGTNCALIIKKYDPEAELVSIQILDENGRGMACQLSPALKWCFSNGIRLINLSLGTTHFGDRERIRKIINFYANKGMIFVAAFSNDGFLTYPASFSNVIGVVEGDALAGKSGHKMQQGVDFTAPSEHEIMIQASKIKLGKCNSYAAPYITALCGKVLEKEPDLNLIELKDRLNQLLVLKPGKLDICHNPDWICAAWIAFEDKNARIKPYFKCFYGDYSKSRTSVDTLILKEKKEIEQYGNEDKHIVYLGEENICCHNVYKHCWSKHQRIEDILTAEKRETDLNIPLILFEFRDSHEILYWAKTIKNLFFEDGYNIYTMCSQINGILYDLEYLPKELCREKYKEKLHDFLYWQIFFQKADGILLFSTDPFLKKLWKNQLDMRITVNKNKKGYFIQINTQTSVNIYFETDSIQYEQMIAIYKKMLKDLS